MNIDVIQIILTDFQSYLSKKPVKIFHIECAIQSSNVKNNLQV